MLGSFLVFISPLIGKIIGWTILVGFFCLFLKLRFKSWKKLEEEMKLWESLLLKNIGISSIALIMVFVGLLVSDILGEKKSLSPEYLLSGIGLTVAFWYGYKKYERDKEIELIKYYSEKYNEINNKIKSADEENADQIIYLFSELISLWYAEFHLWKQGYVSDKLWQEWEYWIKSDTFLSIYNGYSGFHKKYGGDYILNKGARFDIYFLRALLESYGLFIDKTGRMNWTTFQEMLLPTINDVYDLVQKNTKIDIKNTPGYVEMDGFFRALNSDAKS